MTRLILLATLLAAFTVLSPPATDQGLGTPSNARAPSGHAPTIAASTDEQETAAAPDASVAPDRVPTVGGADAMHSRWNDRGGDPDHLTPAIAQAVKTAGDLRVGAMESTSQERWRIPLYVAKRVTASHHAQPAPDRSCTLVFQPPYEQSCYSWGNNFSLPGTAEYRHACNQYTGYIGTYASGFIGGSAAEAMQRVTFFVESPCEVTFDADIIRLGGTAYVGLAAFAGTEKTWVIDNWENYFREDVETPWTFERGLHLIFDFIGLLPLSVPEDIAQAISTLSTLHQFWVLLDALEDYLQAGDAQLLHVTDSFSATAGYHTIYVGLRSNASAFVTGSAFAVSAGAVTQITVSGSGLLCPGGCCRPDGSECVESVYEDDCLASGWAYAGDGVSCAQANCAHRCPDECDRCWLDTIYEGDCPPEWNGAGNGCDCYCQFTDADCAPCICGNGVCQYGPPCFEERQTCPTDCSVLDGDLATRGVWLSSIADDWDGEAIVLEPVEGQTVYIHYQYDTMGSGILPLHSYGITIDGEVSGGGWVSNRPWGYRVRNCAEWVVLSGNHTACGIADYTDFISEPDENNNTSCLYFTALPDCECEHDFECDDGNPCTDDWCDCDCYYTNNMRPCDDGEFCNGADACAGGDCSVHDDDPCLGGGECADACNEDADNCFDPASTPCSDDGNPCTYDWCDGHGDCTHPFKPDGTACPEGRCSDGVCIPEPDINCEALEVYYFGAVAENTCSEEHTWEIVNTGWALLDGEGAGVALTGQDASQFEITRGGGYDCLPLSPR